MIAIEREGIDGIGAMTMGVPFGRDIDMDETATETEIETNTETETDDATGKNKPNTKAATPRTAPPTFSAQTP